MKKPIIIGAGMAGLLAAGMLRGDCEKICERQNSVPNNHSAVLRFRSSVVGDALNIPFKKVTAVKASAPWKNPIADAVSYSRKTNGTATLRSIISADATSSERYIAPEDLISRMVDRVEVPIETGVDLSEAAQTEAPIISTVPMPVLMDYLGWKDRPDFASASGTNYSATIPEADIYCSLYVPDPDLPFSRISITGDKLVVECYANADKHAMTMAEILVLASKMLGLCPMDLESPKASAQLYGKILPIDEGVRREFISFASEKMGIHSLGRYATWRPSLLLDDAVNDVRVLSLIHI